jgi:hypothetical protein
MGQRIIRVDYDALAAAFKLPPGVRIVAVSTHDGFCRDQIMVKVESAEFGPTPPGCPTPETQPIYRLTNTGAEFAGWGFNATTAEPTAAYVPDTGCPFDTPPAPRTLSDGLAEKKAREFLEAAAPPGSYATDAKLLGISDPTQARGRTDKAMADYEAGKINVDEVRAAFGLPPKAGGHVKLSDVSPASPRFRTVDEAMADVYRHRERVTSEMPASLWLYIQSDLVGDLGERVVTNFAGGTVEHGLIPDGGMPDDCVWLKVTIPAKPARGREFI